MTRDDIARVLDARVALRDGLDEIAERREERDAEAEASHLSDGQREEDTEAGDGCRRADDGAEEALDRLVRADRRAELMAADGRAHEVSKGVTGPGADEHDPDHRTAELKGTERGRKRRLRVEAAQHDHVREGQAEVEDAGDRGAGIDKGDAAVQEDALQEHDEHDARRDGHRLFGIAEPRAAPEQEEPEDARQEGEIVALAVKGARVFKPGQYREHEGKAREQGPARLDDKGSQRDADHSCDDSCKQRKRSYLLSYLLVRPPKRRSRPAKSTIASTKQAGVKSGQLTSVK